MTRAIPWDGVGSKDECLLLCVWKHDGDAEWIHFKYREADYEGPMWDGENVVTSGHNDQYFNDSSTITVSNTATQWGQKDRFEPDDAFTITHYAALPTVTTVDRIENDVEEGAVLG